MALGFSTMGSSSPYQSVTKIRDNVLSNVRDTLDEVYFTQPAYRWEWGLV